MASRMDAIKDSEWEERARTSRYRVSSLARSAKTSRQHLRSFFLYRFHMSPKKWLDRQKLRDALPHLRNGEMIKALHEQFGFSQPNDFARAFRRVSGRNPNGCRDPNVLPFQQTFQKAPKPSQKRRNIPKSAARVVACRRRQRV